MAKLEDSVAAIDLFCGAGGLSFGLQQAGVNVVAGIDLDPGCDYPFESNIQAPFLERDVRDVRADHLDPLWAYADWRLLAGCAPCQPFSPYRRGIDTSDEDEWSLLAEFSRLVEETSPDFVTMENVPRIGSERVFGDFTNDLEDLGYYLDYRSCYCPEYGLPQNRRRLVLIASQLGPIEIPEGTYRRGKHKTVNEVIGKLPPIASGETHPDDPLHRSRKLTPLNLKRIRASTPGGTWEDWPTQLRSPCHRVESGASYRNVYARMEWDKPAPTITTLAHNFGTGRFGHPDQDRPISLREAAMLQGFPRSYRFVAPTADVYFNHVGRLIGNAVPPPIGKMIGNAILSHIAKYS